MKKMMAVILAAVMLMGLCAAMAEGARNQTVKQAIGDWQQYNYGIYLDSFVVLAGKDGKLIRIVAQMNDTAWDMQDAIMEVESEEDFYAAIDAYYEYLFTLPVDYVEEITAPPIPQEELDAMKGKSLLELEKEIFEPYDFVEDVIEGKPSYMVIKGLYLYAVDFGASFASYEEFEQYAQTNNIGDQTVTGATFSGLPSPYALELGFLADGSDE